MWNPMSAWENWSRRQYDIWGSKVQERYNFWDDYDDPELREKCRKVWEVLPKKLQKQIYKFLIEILERYGKDFAKKVISGLSESFTGFGIGV